MSDKIHTLIKLGPRLHQIASYVPVGANLGDIGTDHAYLPVYLTQREIISKAIGVDIHKGPFDSAVETVQTYGLKDKIEIRLGDGLVPLRAGEVDVLSIAGMGGTTILRILAGKPQVLSKVTRLILQPQGAEARVRQNLLTQGWKLKDESLVEEEGKIYNVLCFAKSEGLSLDHIEKEVHDLAELLRSEPYSDSTLSIHKLIWQLGPLNMLKKDKLLNNIIEDNIITQQKVIAEMNKTEREDVKAQAEKLGQDIEIMEVMLKWLSQ